uniref:Uncharacterized protein n=1 Tax=Oryza sativa subsp. japonica TaxID=39947 RepID=Q2QV79_ORYSJ|nr:hypothetical protein LOC_Os12g13740 [Oryza sativa Japonica Group]
MAWLDSDGNGDARARVRSGSGGGGRATVPDQQPRPDSRRGAMSTSKYPIFDSVFPQKSRRSVFYS